MAATPLPLDRLRIVQVIPTLRTGGLERVSVRLSVRLAPLVERIVIASSGGTPFEEVAREAGVPVARIPRPLRPPHKLASASWALARVLRREQPHLIHAHNPMAGATAALARTLARMPELAIITTFHGVDPHELGRAGRALALASDFVVGVSPTVTAALRELGLAEEQTETVFNAVELDHSRSREEVRREFGVGEAELIVNVGRYVAQKNHPLLLEAIGLLVSTRPGLRALLVGLGPLEDATRADIDRRGLSDVVTLTGRRTDALDIAAAADVFVLSSRTEAMPLALLEAMGAGRPVVSTAVGGIADAIRDDDSGLLVAPGDAPALAAAIDRVLDDKALADRLGASAARFVAENCNEDAMIEHYTRVYEAALRNHNAGGRLTRRRRRGRGVRSDPQGEAEREP